MNRGCGENTDLTCSSRIQERDEKENGAEKGFKETIAKHLPSWMKDIDLQIQEG